MSSSRHVSGWRVLGIGSDGSATVPSSRTADSATFALNSGPCFFRLFAISHLRRPGLLRDNLDEKRIASSRNVPERIGHCLIRMLPSARRIVNRVAPQTRFPVRSVTLLSRPDLAPPGRGAQRRGREERSRPEPRAARSFARAWRGWRAPDLPRSEHRGTLRISRRTTPPLPLTSVT
jgi:hypothetical protein